MTYYKIIIFMLGIMIGFLTNALFFKNEKVHKKYSPSLPMKKINLKSLTPDQKNLYKKIIKNIKKENFKLKNELKKLHLELSNKNFNDNNLHQGNKTNNNLKNIEHYNHYLNQQRIIIQGELEAEILNLEEILNLTESQKSYLYKKMDSEVKNQINMIFDPINSSNININEQQLWEEVIENALDEKQVEKYYIWEEEKETTELNIEAIESAFEIKTLLGLSDEQFENIHNYYYNYLTADNEIDDEFEEIEFENIEKEIMGLQEFLSKEQTEIIRKIKVAEQNLFLLDTKL